MKQALHTAVPERLLSRDDERASIRSFLEEKVLRRLPGSLYISGAPGTGKTACLNCVLQEMKVLRRHRSGTRKIPEIFNCPVTLQRTRVRFLKCVCLVSHQAELSSVQTVVVNCMTLRSSHAIFPLLAEKLKAPGGQNGLQRFLAAPGPAV